EAAVLLGHGQGQEPVLAEQFQIPARKLEFVVRALGVVAHFLLAELDQRGPQLFVPLSQHPVGIPVVAESPERLGTPHLFLAQPEPLCLADSRKWSHHSGRRKPALHPAEITPDTWQAEGDRAAPADRRRPGGWWRGMVR